MHLGRVLGIIGDDGCVIMRMASVFKFNHFLKRNLAFYIKKRDCFSKLLLNTCARVEMSSITISLLSLNIPQRFKKSTQKANDEENLFFKHRTKEDVSL